MAKNVFELPEGIQRAILYLFKSDEDFHHTILNLVKKSYFELPIHQNIFYITQTYRAKYLRLPSDDIILNEAKLILNKGELISEYDDELTYCNKTGQYAVDNEEYILEQIEKFAKRAASKEALEKAVELAKEDKFDEIHEVFKSVSQVSRLVNVGHKYYDDLEARVNMPEEAKKKFPVFLARANTALEGGHSPKELCMVVAPPGCHAKGTEIIMFDGSIKKVEDVRVGDVLLGPDSKPRNVLSLARGYEKMIRIIPTKGEPFVINENHILSLKRSKHKRTDSKSGEIVNISFKDWKAKSTTFKHHYKLYRPAEITFSNNTKLEIDPYLLGLYLGDGHLGNSPNITSVDTEIIEEFSKIISINYSDLKVSIKPEVGKIKTLRAAKNGGKLNSLTLKFKKLGLLGTLSGTKFIPREYKTSTLTNRLRLLAGLLDTDGHLGNNCFEYCSKSKQLIDDVLFVARSCGLAAYLGTKKCINGVLYYRINISGNIDIIPTRITRKKATTRSQIKSHLVTGFTYEELPEDYYYGFHLDADHLYLLKDFTVTHNTGKSLFLVNQSVHLMRHGLKVLYISLEMSEDKIAQRFDSVITELGVKNIKTQKQELIKGIKDFYTQYPDSGLVIKEFPTSQATVNHIRVLLTQLRNQNKFIPDVICVDYLELLRPIRYIDGEYAAQQRIAEELRGLGVEMNMLVWTATQTNRDAKKAPIIKDVHMADSYGKVRTADWIVSLNQTDDERSRGRMRTYVLKARDSENNYIIPTNIDYSTLVMYDDVDSAEEVG